MTTLPRRVDLHCPECGRYQGTVLGGGMKSICSGCGCAYEYTPKELRDLPLLTRPRVSKESVAL